MYILDLGRNRGEGTAQTFAHDAHLKEMVAEVLDYVQFHETVLVDRMRRQLQDARQQGRLSVREANIFLRFYQEGLKGYTYLEEETPALLKGLDG